MSTPSNLPFDRAPSTGGSTTLRAYAPWILAAAVFLLGLTWIGSEATYHGDERFYTDATLRMLASGDLWRPEYADGSARLNKPLLVYWIMAVPFELFGASLFAARLPFLLAGALLVVATARLAKALFPTEPRAPFLAAAIAASNVSLSTLFLRSTPDVLLVLAMTIAWVGLADLLVAGRSARQAAPWLWIGIGFAAAAKGGLAIVLLLFVVVAIAGARRPGVWRELSHIPTLVFAIALAGVSLAPLWFSDGLSGGPSFLQDQVTTKIARSLFEAGELGLEYLGSLARHFLPWLLAPIVLWFAARETLVATWSRHRRALVLVLAFALTLWLVFTAANMHRGRYLSPAYPPLACAAAVFVQPTLELRAVQRSLRALMVVVAVAAGLITLVLLRVERVDALAAASAGILALYAAWKSELEQRATAFAVVTTAVVFTVVPAVRHAFRSSDIALVATAERIDATWGFDATTSSVVRVVSGGRLDPRAWPEAPSEADFAGASVVLARGPAREALEARGWRLEPIAVRARHVTARDVPRLLLEDDPRAWIASRGETVFLARR